MKYMTIIHGIFDQTRTMFTAYDEYDRKVLIKEELVPCFVDVSDHDDGVRYPFYCRAEYTISELENGERVWVADKCFKTTPEMIEQVNMDLDALEHELSDLCSAE